MDNITKRYMAMDAARHAEYDAKVKAQESEDAKARQADLFSLVVCGAGLVALLLGFAALSSPVIIAIKYSLLF